MNPTSPQQSSTPQLFRPPTAIVYSKDHEPISCIPMNDATYEYFLKYDIVRFPVQVPLDINSYKMDDNIPIAELLANTMRMAEISAMKVYSADGIRLMLIARDDETALLMRNTFLPGQTKELNFIKTQCFYHGMVEAIKKIRNK